jgi:general nucleoside transport system permease protein
MLRIEQRAAPSTAWGYGSPVLALTLTLMFGVALFTLLGKDPARAIGVFLIDPISNFKSFSEVLLVRRRFGYLLSCQRLEYWR